MVNNVLQFITNITGGNIDENFGSVRRLTNLTATTQLISPLPSDFSVMVEYLLASGNMATQYMRLAVDSNNVPLKGKDVVDPDELYYQTVSNYNVWEIEITEDILSMISKYRSGKVYASFIFREWVSAVEGTNYLGTFGSTGDIPASATTAGDYYECDLLSYTSSVTGLTYTYKEAVYWSGAAWFTASSFDLKQSTTSREFPVETALSGQPPQPVDPSFTNQIISELSSHDSRIAQNALDISLIDATAGTDPLDKAQIDANVSNIDDNTLAIISNDADIVALVASDVVLQGNINELKGVGRTTETLKSNKDLITINVSDIFINESDIGTNAQGIIDTQLNVSANASDITDLTTQANLSTTHNTSDGSDHSKVNTNTTSIGTNATNIGTNVSDITSINNTLLVKADLVGGLVPANQLPGYVDDVLEYPNLASFPAVGESGKIYIAIDTNYTYRWSGTVYVQLTGTGGGAVDSVNGEIGVVILDTDNINEGITNKYYTEAKVSANTSVVANTAKTGITTQQATDITTNNAKITYTDAIDVGLNTTHRNSDGTNHSNVVLNDTHRLGDGSDHSIVATNELILSTIERDYVSRDFLNGTFKEQFDAIVHTNGDITLSLEQTGTGDLTMQFSDGNIILDCTPIQSIILSPGSATIPQPNYIYIPINTKILTNSTTGWPTIEHIKISYVLLLDNTFTNGPLINQNWNDAHACADGQGHLSHITKWIRTQGATYFSGINGIGTDGFINIVGANAYWKTSAGIVTQMHQHEFTSKDTSIADNIHIVNHPITPYSEITDLSTLTVDSENVSVNNKYTNLIFWGVANKGGTYDPIMVNLSSGSYTNVTSAINDISNFDNVDIPREYRLDSGTGFLIARITVRISAGVLTVHNTMDLRGKTPSTIGGGSSGGTVYDNPDSLFTIYDTDDSARIISFDAGNITSGNTRIVTMADTNVDLASIATNVTNIGTNATNIGINTTNIGTNDTDILNIETKTDHITVTQPVNLDTMESNISNNAGDIINIELKTDHITVTQAVNLDIMESGISTNAINIGTNDTDIANIKAKTDFITVSEIVDLDDINTYLTTFNGNSELVMTEIDGKLPALDGSLLTNVQKEIYIRADVIGNVTNVSALGEVIEYLDSSVIYRDRALTSFFTGVVLLPDIGDGLETTDTIDVMIDMVTNNGAYITVSRNNNTFREWRRFVQMTDGITISVSSEWVELTNTDEALPRVIDKTDLPANATETDLGSIIWYDNTNYLKYSDFQTASTFIGAITLPSEIGAADIVSVLLEKIGANSAVITLSDSTDNSAYREFKQFITMLDATTISVASGWSIYESSAAQAEIIDISDLGAVNQNNLAEILWAQGPKTIYFDSYINTLDITGLIAKPTYFTVDSGVSVIIESMSQGVGVMTLSTGSSDENFHEFKKYVRMTNATTMAYQSAWVETTESGGLTTTDDLSEGLTNLYYTDARVSANTDVSANTTAKNTYLSTFNGISQLVLLDSSGNLPALDASALINVPGGSVAMDDLTDADTTTVAPLANNLLTYDGVNWIPANEIAAKTNETVPMPTTGWALVGEFYEANVTTVNTIDVNAHITVSPVVPSELIKQAWLEQGVIAVERVDANTLKIKSEATNSTIYSIILGIGANVSLTTDITDLNSMSDVTLTGVLNGDFLLRSSGVWVNTQAETFSIYNFDDIDEDVVSADGDVLMWTGGASGSYKPRQFDDLGGNIGELSDVDTTTSAPLTNDILTYTGTNWEPVAPAAAGGGEWDWIGIVNPSLTTVYDVSSQFNFRFNASETDTEIQSKNISISNVIVRTHGVVGNNTTDGNMVTLSSVTTTWQDAPNGFTTMNIGDYYDMYILETQGDYGAHIKIQVFKITSTRLILKYKETIYDQA